MNKYVLGFAFNAEKDFVVLIQKNKPAWQKGNLNGVGGKIESGESAKEAMVREFKEETGLSTAANDWQEVGKMGGADWECNVFTAMDDSFMHAETLTDEEVSVYEVQEIIRGEYAMITNVPFLIELCRDANRPKFTNVEY